ncbi:MAG: hypothetical protein II448_02425, partial [Paludibacteraceae bacterium]|nr:hypothetical protein [Paludibacteraceae bacterium]
HSIPHFSLRHSRRGKGYEHAQKEQNQCFGAFHSVVFYFQRAKLRKMFRICKQNVTFLQQIA